MTRDGNSEEFSPDEGPRTPDAEGVPETGRGSRPSAAELAQWLGGREFFRVTLRDGQVIALVELRESPSEMGRYLREHSTPCAEAAPLPAASGAPDAPASAPAEERQHAEEQVQAWRERLERARPRPEAPPPGLQSQPEAPQEQEHSPWEQAAQLLARDGGPAAAEWLQTLPPARRSLLLHLMSLPAGVAARFEAAQQQQELATRQWAAARYRQLAGGPAPGTTPPTESPSAATSPRRTAIDAVQVRDMVRHEVCGLALEFLCGLAPGASSRSSTSAFRPRPP